MKPKVSILCITYNHVDYIEKAIEGFLMQKTDFPYEIIIHDDASTDGTTEIVKKYESKYNNIRLICQDENKYSKGVKIFGEILLPLSQAEYIAICEGDDFWTDENKLQIQANILDRHQDCTMCYHLTDELCVTDNSLRKGAPYLWTGKYSINRFNRRRTIIMTCSLFARRAALAPLPNYYFNSAVGDLPLQLHLLSKGKGYYLNKNMATHLYMTPGSWSERHTNQDKKAYVSRTVERIAMFQKFDEDTGYKYHKVAQAEISRRLYNMEMEFGNIKSAKRIRAFCKTNLKSNILDKIKLMNPQVYNRMLKIRTKLRVQK